MIKVSSLLRFLPSLVLFLSASDALADNKVPERQKASSVAVNLYTEVTSLDPNRQLDALCAFWLGHIYEGLITYDKKGGLVNGAAHSVEVSKDKRVYTFHLRDAKWHDGRPVVAGDFVYSFRRLVDPKYASEYAFIAESARIKNAVKVTNGSLPPSSLGVAAKDDKTLVVELEGPVPYFLSLVALNPFFPVRQDLVEKFKETFGVEAASVVGNGPFRLTKWKRETSMELERFDGYWNHKDISMKKILMPAIVQDSRASYLMYETGAIDLLQNLDSELVKSAMESKKRIQHMQSGVLWYMVFNQRKGALMANPKLREAVKVGLPRKEFVDKIVSLPGHAVANGFVPPLIASGVKGKKFRALHPLPAQSHDLARAQALVQQELKARQTKLPAKIRFLMGSDPHDAEAEFLRDQLAKIFKTQVVLEVGPFKVRAQKLRDGDFDIALASWVPDYDDPMTYLEVFTSGGAANYGHYSNENFDKGIEAARAERDEARRAQRLFELEKTLLVDVAALPVEFSARAYVVRDGLNDLVRRVFGPDPDLRFTNWNKER